MLILRIQIKHYKYITLIEDDTEGIYVGNVFRGVTIFVESKSDLYQMCM